MMVTKKTVENGKIFPASFPCIHTRFHVSFRLFLFIFSLVSKNRSVSLLVSSVLS